LNEINNLDYCLNMIENVVKTTILPQEEEYIDKIKTLTLEKELIEIKHQKNILEEKNKHLEEMNKQLKDNINDLRRKVK